MGASGPVASKRDYSSMHGALSTRNDGTFRTLGYFEDPDMRIGDVPLHHWRAHYADESTHGGPVGPRSTER